MKNITLVTSVSIFLMFNMMLATGFAQEEVGLEEQQILPSSEYVRLMWAAQRPEDAVRLKELLNECVSVYGEEAKELQANLTGFPSNDIVKDFQALNDVGTCMFIYGEYLKETGQSDAAIEHLKKTIEEYSFARAWDPRGWFWSIAEKSQATIDFLENGVVHEEHTPIRQSRTIPILADAGSKEMIDYDDYGVFHNIGQARYHYSIQDKAGLIEALGEGVYPNISSVYKNPRFKITRDEGRLEGSHWDYVNSDDLEAAYFKWFSAPEPWGVRMFYVGTIFEKAGLYNQALKAYHSLVVHFPKTIAYTYWQTPWYPAQAAIAKIKHILRLNPNLNLKVQRMNVKVLNGLDNDPGNDDFLIYPGKITKLTYLDRLKQRINWQEFVDLGEPVKKVGDGRVRLVQYANRHWQLMVNDEPFVIKGVTYAPTKIGQSPDKGTLENWMEEDSNNNGKIDGPYDAWIDENRNNKRDENEPVIGDFQILKDLGVNAIRIYHDPETPNKELLREMHARYGIYVIMSDFLGKYAKGSKADWSEGTDYENDEHKKNMLESVTKMVMEHKDEPYVLMWMLGNENNYGVACNANEKPDAYYKYLNLVTRWIKSVDPNHPVAMNNGDTLFLDKFAEHAPDVDIFSANVYRGDYGFGSFWEQVQNATDKPAFILEYGAPAFAQHLTLEEAEKAQADYHLGNWMDIEENFAGRDGVGNSLGGVVFEYLDEWWKNYDPYRHDKKSDAIGPFPGGFYYEEWFGIVGQGSGRYSPFMRHPRKAFYLYKELWNR